MKKTTKVYEFFYSVTSNAISKEVDNSFSFDGVCLKHALIKFAGHLASFSDYSPDRYQFSNSYLVDGKPKELCGDVFSYLQYYIQYNLLYEAVK